MTQDDKAGVDMRLRLDARDAGIRELVVERIGLGRITSYEVEGEEVIANIVKIRENEKWLYLPITEVGYGWHWQSQFEGIPQEGMSDGQKIRLKRAVELNLPPLAAVHLALNTDEDLEKYNGENLAATPNLIALYGAPNALKSKTLAILGQVTSLPIVSLDWYSPRGVGSYVEALRKKGITKEDGLDRMITALDEVEVSGQPQRLSLKETLDGFCTMFLGGKRDEIILVDFPGYDGKRKQDGLDLLATYGLTTLHLNPVGGQPSVAEYLQGFRENIGLDFYEINYIEGVRNEAFRRLVMAAYAKAATAKAETPKQEG